MNRAYESAAREAQEIMAQAYEREEAARAEVFPHGGESDRRSGEKAVFPHGGESDPSGGETAVFPHAGESEGRAVGAEDRLLVDFYTAQLKRGDIVLLCTDGLTTMLRDEEIEEVIEPAGEEASEEA